METTRFDHIISSLAQTHTRRGALRLLATAALGAGGLTLLGHDAGQAKKKGKGKKGKNKKKGQTPVSPSPAPPNECAALFEGASCGFRGCMVCRNGACVVDASREGGTCGNGGCLICLNGVCSTNPKNDDTCGVGGEGRCSFGACNPKPTCIGTEAMCAGGPASCCSGQCGGGACVLVSAGGQCKRGEDCTSGSCIGYRCQ